MGMANKSGTAEIYLQLAEQCAAIEGVYLSAYPEKEIAEAKILTRLTKSKAVYGAIACLDAEVVGFIILLSSGESSDILEICVAPMAQNNGIGKMLLTAAIELSIARKLQKIILEVAEDNAIAQQLYRRADFREIGRRQGYYQRGARQIDALVMEKQLPSGY
jgi:ribosomal-protein-alanine N-acetyltransferase